MGDISICPKALNVMHSGSHKIDGQYARMDEPSRGKPSYVMMLDGSRPVYLFWNKKWLIGGEFGSTRHMASCQDAEVLCPCEPYPHPWKVKEKKEKGQNA